MKLAKREYISELLKAKTGSKCMAAGWVHNIRALGNLMFIVLRDKTGNIQITLKKPDSEKLFELAKRLTKESVIGVEGVLKDNKQVPGGKELIPSDLEVLSTAETPMPIDFSNSVETGFAKRLDWRFIDMRNPKIMGIFKLESSLVTHMSRYLLDNGFTHMFFSKFVDKPTEGGANFFPVVYFNKEAYLAQSPQLHKQSIMASGMDRVFDCSNVFRAEPHHTVRHVCEFNSFDYEMAFIDSVEDVLKMEENMIKEGFKGVKKDCADVLEFYNIKLEVPETPFPRVTATEACKILKMKEVGDIDSDGEVKLHEYVKKKYNHDFIFIKEFPWSIKPFYIMRKEDDPELTHGFDLDYKGLEITSGGQREHRYNKILENCKDKGINPEQFDHLRFFRYGMPPHGGLGLGIERLAMKILGLPNIKEAVLTPRDPERLTP